MHAWFFSIIINPEVLSEDRRADMAEAIRPFENARG